jgi:hypothetical protein
MKSAVRKIAEQVKALPKSELDEFLSWLAEYGIGHSDEWDKEIERDSREGGPLSPLLKRVRTDIASKRTKPLDEILNNS